MRGTEHLARAGSARGLLRASVGEGGGGGVEGLDANGELAFGEGDGEGIADSGLGGVLNDRASRGADEGKAAAQDLEGRESVELGRQGAQLLGTRGEHSLWAEAKEALLERKEGGAPGNEGALGKEALEATRKVV